MDGNSGSSISCNDNTIPSMPSMASSVPSPVAEIPRLVEELAVAAGGLEELFDMYQNKLSAVVNMVPDESEKVPVLASLPVESELGNYLNGVSVRLNVVIRSFSLLHGRVEL